MKNSRCLRTCWWKFSSSLGVLLWLLAAAGFAAEVEKTTITSEKLTVRSQEQKAIFEGSVVLTKGALIVHSDIMVVSFQPSGTQGAAEGHPPATPPSSSQPGATGRPSAEGTATLPQMSNQTIHKIEATGRVRIAKEEGRATCHRAVYFAGEDKIVLTGEPVAWENGTRVSGKKITMYLAENRSVVEGDSQVLIESPGEGGS